MIRVIARVDDLGKPAWIALMVLGFVVYWPIGLAILAYIIWSGRMGMWSGPMGRWSGPMGCGWHGGRGGDVEEWRTRAIERVNRMAEHWEHRRARREERRRQWGGRHGGHGGGPGSGHGGGQYGSMGETGNRAFDEYRTDALRKLEEEANEFRAFLERLRMARDRAEFDEYVQERRNRPAAPSAEGPPAPPPT